MRKLSLRVKIVGVFVLIYGAVFVLLLGWLMRHIEQDFIKEIDANLQTMVAEIDDVISRGPNSVDSLRVALEQTATLIAMQEHIWLGIGDSTIYRCRHLPSKLRKSDSPDETMWTTEAEGEKWYRYIRKQSGSYHIQAAQEITAIEHTLHESELLFLASIPMVVLLSFAGGYYLVRRLLHPLDVIMRRAQHISSENLAERIPSPGSDDEIDRVVSTLNAMIERLERSFSQLEGFTANASHELRTPLTILKGEIEVALQRARSAEEYRIVLESNLEEVRRIARTVEHLFLLARIDSNAISAVREPVSLKSLLEEIVHAANILAAESDVHIESMLDDVPDIQGDAVLLVQLFLNLVENGIKYNRPGGTLRLSLSTEGQGRAVPSAGGVWVEISDTGIGMPEKDLPFVFDRFYRVDKQLARSRGGAGLGLSIAQWIVRMHDGTIDVRSREGKETVFTVMLPLS
jgi:heavy metal sensor kinase